MGNDENFLATLEYSLAEDRESKDLTLTIYGTQGWNAIYLAWEYFSLRADECWVAFCNNHPSNTTTQ